ncbi:hypothetical protein [Teichococcus aestuarii]|uniref:hypothetical protein n=1 Tax=Teichococcus aestuarii TaxID=568898 RepID=UPI00361161C9
MLVRHRFLSLDPYMRGRMDDSASYSAPVKLGEVMEGECVGEVVESRNPAFAPGDWVGGARGWQLYSAAPGHTVQKLPGVEGVPPSAYLGVLGMPGTTAWVGVTEIGQPRPGRPSSSPPPPARWGASRGRSPRPWAAASSASRGARRSAAT